MEFEKFKEFSREVILQSLALGNEQILKLKAIGDLSGYELLEKEFIPKYEKLYFAITLPDFQKNYEESPEIGKQLTNILNEIMKKNGFSEEYIFEKLKLRKALKTKDVSGAEVVKKLYEFELNEIQQKIKKYLREANKILKEEYRLSDELSKVIQQEEQTKLIYKLHPLRERFIILNEQILRFQEKEIEIQKNIASEWKYEIYGTFHKDDLKNKTREVLKNEKIN
ncbi:MAG: hypothetical protein ACRCVS_00250 [Fusobacteriaceae bacterium]